MDLVIFDPYCGSAPLPADLWTRWNFDPYLLAALALGWGLWRRHGRHDRAGVTSFRVAYLLIFVAFISPLCALSSALFAARVAHHLILIGAIAPLLVRALPWSRGPALPLSVVVIAHALVVWVWHAPAPYALALSSDAAYWLMQGTLLMSAWLFWREIFSTRPATGATVIALLVTIMQMGLLGALLVFSPEPLFTPHFTTTLPFGLTPLGDQQLAGLLMWVPAFLPYAAIAAVQVYTLLSQRERTPLLLH